MALLLRLLFVRKKSLDEFRSVLVVAPHPDDEIIGLGGYLLRQAASGCGIAIVYLSDGEKSLEDIESQTVADQRRRLSLGVHERLGISSGKVWWLRLPDGSIPRKGDVAFDGAVEQVSEIIRKTVPDAVFVTHPMDTWPFDHIAACEIAAEAMDKVTTNCAFFGYWVWLWYSMPSKALLRMRWRDISRIPLDGMMLATKTELMDAYLKPLAPNGKPWSGVLPEAMLKAFRYPFEVVEKLK